MLHNRRRRHSKSRQAWEDLSRVDFQREILRAIGKVRVAQEILSALIVLQDNSIEELLQDRADALGSSVTRAELEVMSRFVRGESTETIAEERGLSERTVSNQLSTGCHKLGFGDRRELKGWGDAVSRFVLAQRDEPQISNKPD